MAKIRLAFIGLFNLATVSTLSLFKVLIIIFINCIDLVCTILFTIIDGGLVFLESAVETIDSILEWINTDE